MGTLRKRSRTGLTAATLALAVVSGCQAPATTPRPAGTRPPKAAADALAPAKPGIAPPALISDKGGGVVSNNGAGLVGKVKAPAGLISDKGGGVVSNNGAGIVSNNGGSVVSNNGAGYRLAALPEQVPVTGATVALVDAADAPVAGSDGAPLITTTGADGGYAFPGPLPARNLRVVVALPGDRGRLEAIAPRTADPAAPRAADVDVVSTLASAYVQRRYVAGQPDPVATLERLPADVEAETRVRTAAALAADPAPPPASLTADEVVVTVERLRARDAALDAHLATVKRLLIPAGALDLGDGQIATDVRLAPIRSLVVAPDGVVYLNCPADRRVWRLGADGRLATAAGAAGDGVDVVYQADGRKAAGTSLLPMDGLALDAAGRVVMLERELGGLAGLVAEDDGFAVPPVPLSRALALEADGTLDEIGLVYGVYRALVKGAGGTLAALAVDVAGGVARLDVVGSPTQRGAAIARTTAPADVAILAATRVYGADAQGRLYVAAPDAAGKGGVWRLAPGADRLERVATAGDGTWAAVTVDPNGVVFAVAAADRRVAARPPEGPERTVLAALPAGLDLDGAPVALLADGTAYFGEGGRLWKAAGGVLTRMAGLAPGAAGPSAGPTAAPGVVTDGKLAFARPAGVAVAADGTIYVADLGAHQLVRVAAGRGTLVAGDGSPGDAGDGGSAALARLEAPSALRLAPDGSLYVVDGDRKPGNRVRRIADGRIARVYDGGADRVEDVLVRPDGQVVVGATTTDGTARLLAVEPGGARELARFPRRTDGNAWDAWAFAIDPTGDVYVGGQGTLRRWDGKAVAELPDYRVSIEAAGTGSLAVDGERRIYVARNQSTSAVQAFKPPGPSVRVAGDGGLYFAGDAVDEAVRRPWFLHLAPNGDLYFTDHAYRQVRAIPAAGLAGGAKPAPAIIGEPPAEPVPPVGVPGPPGL